MTRNPVPLKVVPYIFMVAASLSTLSGVLV
jgi:hypothetical protein